RIDCRMHRVAPIKKSFCNVTHVTHGQRAARYSDNCRSSKRDFTLEKSPGFRKRARRGKILSIVACREYRVGEPGNKNSFIRHPSSSTAIQENFEDEAAGARAYHHLRQRHCSLRILGAVAARCDADVGFSPASRTGVVLFRPAGKSPSPPSAQLPP